MTRGPSSRPRPQAAPPPPPKGKLTPGVVILTIILMLAAFSCGFGALTVQADFSRPVAAGNAPTQAFVVHSGDSATTITTNLEQQHLIRSAYFFKIFLKVKGLVFAPDPGTYQVSPSMSPTQIVTVLSVKQADKTVKIRVIEGSRLSEFPAQIVSSLAAPDLKNPPNSALPNFSVDDFTNLTIKGQGLDAITKQYWYVKPWKTPPAFAALEGYLMADTYIVSPNATAMDIITQMLNELGEQLCPGTNTPTDYIFDMVQCKKHQAQIARPPNGHGVIFPDPGSTIGAFDALDKYYGANGTDYAGALQKVLILASLAQREARSAPNFAMVASTYYNRWKDTGADPFGYLGADPAEQYQIASQPGYKSDPWAGLTNAVNNLPNGPYNLYISTPTAQHVKGLPPSAISNPGPIALAAALYPPKTNYHFFFFGCDGFNHYAPDDLHFEADKGKYKVDQGNGSCPK